jgi:hypothetical protein
LVDRITKSINHFELEHNGLPNFSTLPTGEVNACAVELPYAKKAFLLFDSQLFTFCHLFSKAFALCLPLKGTSEGQVQLSTEITEVIEHVKSNENSCLLRVVDVLTSYCLKNRPGDAEQYYPPRDYITYVDLIRDGMELMIVGHELGHYFSGHLNSGIKNVLSEMYDQDLMSTAHQDEYVADFWGAVLSMQALSNEGYDAALSFIGIDLFFSSMILCCRFSSLMAGIKDEHFEEEESETHPTFKNRQAFLRQAIMDVEGIDEHKEQIQDFYNFYDKCIEAVWLEVVQANKRVN